MDHTTNATVSPIRLTVAELAAITQLADTDAARRTAELLRVTKTTNWQEAIRHGMSSLIARGLADISGEDVSTSAEATVIARVMQVADRWAEIALVSEASSEGALMVSSPRGCILFGASPADTFDAIAIDPARPVGSVVANIAGDFLRRYDTAAAAVTVYTADEQRHAALRRRGNAWALAEGAFDEEGLMPTAESNEDSGLSAIASLWDGDNDD